MHNLMVVSHPDDESLFGGVQLLKGDWRVVCVTNGDNPVRRSEFEQVMRMTCSQFEIWDYHDEFSVPLDEDKLRVDLKNLVNSQVWDRVLTHNEEGEYGHIHHIQINKLMREIVGISLWVFDFNGLVLPKDVWASKWELVKVYKSQRGLDRFIPRIKRESVLRQIAFL